MRQIIGAQLYTLREFIQTPEDFEKTLVRVAALGLTAAQVSGAGPDVTGEVIARASKNTGIEICCTHTPLARLENELDAVAREHLLFGCPAVGLTGWAPEKLTDEAGMEAFIDWVNRVSERLSAYGLKFAYHNHLWDVRRFDGETILERLARKTDPNRTELIFCCYWAAAGGCDPVEMLHRLAGRVRCCHYKDMVPPRALGTFEFREVGEGNMNYRAITRACEETGVRYALIEQDQCQRDPFESLAISTRAIARYGKELE